MCTELIPVILELRTDLRTGCNLPLKHHRCCVYLCRHVKCPILISLCILYKAYCQVPDCHTHIIVCRFSITHTCRSRTLNVPLTLFYVNFMYFIWRSVSDTDVSMLLYTILLYLAFYLCASL